MQAEISSLISSETAKERVGKGLNLFSHLHLVVVVMVVAVVQAVIVLISHGMILFLQIVCISFFFEKALWTDGQT